MCLLWWECDKVFYRRLLCSLLEKSRKHERQKMHLQIKKQINNSNLLIAGCCWLEHLTFLLLKKVIGMRFAINFCSSVFCLQIHVFFCRHYFDHGSNGWFLEMIKVLFFRSMYGWDSRTGAKCRISRTAGKSGISQSRFPHCCFTVHPWWEYCFRFRHQLRRTPPSVLNHNRQTAFSSLCYDIFWRA